MFITEWLDKKGLNQRQGARLLGLDEGTLSRYCRRAQMPSIAVAFEIELKTSGEVPIISWVPPTVAAQLLAAVGVTVR